jgi:PAS domain S-box-containing protein
MWKSYQDQLRRKEIRNLRLLNVFSSVVVTVLGFVFEFAYHDGSILITGLICSLILTSNYFLSYYASFYSRNLSNITFLSIFLLHFWEVYVAYVRGFSINIIIPLSISVFTFSLIFDRFFKSLFFIFCITSFMFVLMMLGNKWQPEYTITLISLYSGAFISQEFIKRKAEFDAEIQKREKTYTSLVENMNDGLIYLDEDRRISYFNDKFSKITGYHTSELIGKSIESLTVAPGTNAEIKPGNSLKPGSILTGEMQIETRDKRKIWVQVTSENNFPKNGFAGTMLVYTDITPLKTVQDNLRKREEGYKTFIDQSAVGIWRAEYMNPIPISLPVNEQIDLLLDTGIISECNDFMAKMYGYNSASELIGRKIRDFYHIENNFDDEKTRELMTLYISNSYRISNAESKERDKAGKVRFMLNNNIGIIENNHLIRTWGVQTDITDRKRTERELMESNQELDTFFYKASHDLKGPLASVMGIVNLARLEKTDIRTEQYFEMIDTSVKRLDSILLDLIELARTRKGSGKLSLINIKNLVNEIITSLRHLPSFEKISFNVEVENNITVYADQVLILSVMQNLIHNAINYGNSENPFIKIHAIKRGDELRLEITDNGKGIPDSIRNKVFEMFYRGNTDSKGSGLGLFIVKNAIEKMNGQINFISTNDGTTFRVVIPDSENNI